VPKKNNGPRDGSVERLGDQRSPGLGVGSGDLSRSQIGDSPFATFKGSTVTMGVLVLQGPSFETWP